MTENQDFNPPRTWKVSIRHYGRKIDNLVGYYSTLADCYAKRDALMKDPQFIAERMTVEIIEAQLPPRSNKKINCLWA